MNGGGTGLIAHHNAISFGGEIGFIPNLTIFGSGIGTFDIAPGDDTTNHSPFISMENGRVSRRCLDGGCYTETTGISVGSSIVMIINIYFVFFAWSNFYLVRVLAIVTEFTNADKVTLITNRSVVSDGVKSRVWCWLFVGVGCTCRSPGRNFCPTQAKNG